MENKTSVLARWNGWYFVAMSSYRRRQWSNSNSSRGSSITRNGGSQGRGEWLGCSHYRRRRSHKAPACGRSSCHSSKVEGIMHNHISSWGKRGKGPWKPTKPQTPMEYNKRCTGGKPRETRKKTDWEVNCICRKWEQAFSSLRSREELFWNSYGILIWSPTDQSMKEIYIEGK